MLKVEWGKKVVCTSCGTKFYDLNRKYPLSCPRCNSKVEEVDMSKLSSSAKKVFTGDIETISDDNLVGSDATESMATDGGLPIEDTDDNETISLEEADQDVDVIETVEDNLDIQETENQDEVE